MRASSIVFLLLFAGLFGHLHREQGGEFLKCNLDRASCDAGARAESLESELKRTEREQRNNKKSLAKLERSVRSLQDLARKSERSLKESVHHDRGADVVAVRRQTLQEVTETLEQSLLGYKECALRQERLDAKHTTLVARLELARAGLADRAAEPVALETTITYEKPSPLEALSEPRARR